MCAHKLTRRLAGRKIIVDTFGPGAVPEDRIRAILADVCTETAVGDEVEPFTGFSLVESD